MPAGGAVAQRVGWVDIAKGVGIILIVIGHANRSIDRNPLLAWTDDLRALDAVLYAFHVPLFFVLAGVSVALARSGWRNGIRSLLLGIVVPYLIWSVIWILSKLMLPGAMVNVPLHISDLWQILWKPVDHFWFLYHLALIRLMWLFAEYLLNQKQQIVMLAGLILVSIGLRLIGEEWTFAAHFIGNAAFFGIGMLLLQPVMSQVVQAGRMATVSLIAFAGLLSVSWFGDVKSVSFITSLAGVFMVIFATAYLDQSSAAGVVRVALERIGQASLAIFLLHVFAIGLMRLLLSKTGILSNETLLIGGSIAGVVLPFVFYVLVRWVSEQADKPVLTWVGLGRWQHLRAGTPA